MTAVTGSPALVASSQRKRWIVLLSVVALLVVMAVAVSVAGGAASSGASKSDTWPAAAKAQMLQKCQGAAGCECAVQWLEEHRTPDEVLHAQQTGRYAAIGAEIIAACPDAKGFGQ
jgi:uncharacterized membrane protein YeiB